MKKIKLLPQTVFEFNCNRKLLKDTLCKVETLSWKKNDHTLISQDFFLNKNHLFDEIHEWFHDCLIKVKQSVEYRASDVVITQSWANRADQGNWHFFHNHPNSVFSGVFYLNDSDVGTTFILRSIWEMYDGSVTSGGIGQPFHHFLSEKTNVVEHTMKEESGKLVIFPSTLVHGVKPNKSGRTRYTISFNSFVSGDIGEFGSLSGLTLDVK